MASIVRTEEQIIESYGEVSMYSSTTRNFKNVYVGRLLLDIVRFDEEVPISEVYRILYNEVINVVGNIEECKVYDTTVSTQ